MTNVLLVGGAGREHAIAKALCRGPEQVRLFAVMAHASPGVVDLSHEWERHAETDVAWIVDWAARREIEFAVVGFEDPLAAGLCDALEARGIRAVGPQRAAARLETSKAFARELMRRHDVPGQIGFHVFTAADAARRFLGGTSALFAVKPAGLSAGKGVRIMGEHLADRDEAARYAAEVIEHAVGGERAVVLEERVEGEEFSVQCFVDGETVVPMPVVQDYKRAYEGNQGPNTGSMGSYSQPDGLLPFLTRADLDAALTTIRGTVRALAAEGIEYTGVLYGQFMLTAGGPKLIEYNARFGDPEAMNVLATLRSDFVGICRAVTGRSLAGLAVEFEPLATVCKYVVPRGYPVSPRVGDRLRLRPLPEGEAGISFLTARVNREGGELVTTTSRALAVLGVGRTLEEAERRAERGLGYIEGPFDVRHDIGRISPSSRPLGAPAG